MMNSIRKVWVGSLVASFTLMSSAQASALRDETRVRLESLRTTIEGWAPMCNGAMALSRECYQGDMVEYAGYRCATGDSERCNDIKEAQAADGRWWRAKSLIGKSDGNSFSRDMFMGLMFYFRTTKDVAAMERWMNYLSNHHNRMCDDASDNRCMLEPSTWGMLGMVREYMGLPRTLKMKLGAQTLPAEMITSSLTAPRGFQLVLVADNLFFLRSIGKHADWMDTVARNLLRRQPDNPLFDYLVNGPNEELAQSMLEACPATPSERADDIFWQRRLDRNDKGELIVVRDDWGPANTRIPVHSMANGHDCLVVLNLLLRHPF